MPIVEIIRRPIQKLEVYLKRGDTGAQGPSGVVSVSSPITNTGTSTAAALGFDGIAYAKTTQPLLDYGKNDTGQTVTKGQVVYISGANGTNALLSLADADAEVTSSKTIGLLYQDLAVNGLGWVVTNGLLSGIDTSGATNAGSSVWLSSVAGGVVYDAPPAKPAHSVYLGVVTRKHAQQGEILIKVQNGYELEELHNVKITNPTDGQVLKYQASTGLWINSN